MAQVQITCNTNPINTAISADKILYEFAKTSYGQIRDLLDEVLADTESGGAE